MHIAPFPFFLIPLIFFGLIITAIIFCARNRRSCGDSHINPRTLLERRFVNGEITSSEYHEMKEVLKEK
ncbi:hypothetical protein ACTWP4_07525 [Gracilibacillus sp. D59]|uniref:hypothetical protein n=1 Tax=Gracilibacillus sp. D59 TaxID=3457434 RepID=UPI003FCE1872